MRIGNAYVIDEKLFFPPRSQISVLCFRKKKRAGKEGLDAERTRGGAGNTCTLTYSHTGESLCVAARLFFFTAAAHVRWIYHFLPRLLLLLSLSLSGMCVCVCAKATTTTWLKMLASVSPFCASSSSPLPPPALSSSSLFPPPPPPPPLVAGLLPTQQHSKKKPSFPSTERRHIRSPPSFRVCATITAKIFLFHRRPNISPPPPHKLPARLLFFFTKWERKRGKRRSKGGGEREQSDPTDTFNLREEARFSSLSSLPFPSLPAPLLPCSLLSQQQHQKD